MNALDSQVAAHKALGHPVRLRLLAMLRPGELCVCQMTSVLGLAFSTVSAHLAELKRAGLVQERKDGRFVSYRLAEGGPERPRAEAALEPLARDPQVEADARLLRRLRRVSVEDLCRVDLDLSRLGIRPEGEARWKTR